MSILYQNNFNNTIEQLIHEGHENLIGFEQGYCYGFAAVFVYVHMVLHYQKNSSMLLLFHPLLHKLYSQPLSSFSPQEKNNLIALLGLVLLFQDPARWEELQNTLATPSFHTRQSFAPSAILEELALPIEEKFFQCFPNNLSRFLNTLSTVNLPIFMIIHNDYHAIALVKTLEKIYFFDQKAMDTITPQYAIPRHFLESGLPLASWNQIQTQIMQALNSPQVYEIIFMMPQAYSYSYNNFFNPLISSKLLHPSTPPEELLYGSDDEEDEWEEVDETGDEKKVTKNELCQCEEYCQENVLHNFICKWDKCNSSFFTNHRDFITHVKNDHPITTSPFDCKWAGCDTVLAYLSNFKNHIRVHTEEKPHLCQSSGCKKAFLRLDHLKSHRRVHTVEKPHKCQECNKCFRDLGNLMAHTALHKKGGYLQEEVLVCKFCPMNLNSQSSLTKHIKERHEEKCPYCPIENCNERIHSIQYLRLHMQSAHKKKNKKCRICICKKFEYENFKQFKEHFDNVHLKDYEDELYKRPTSPTFMPLGVSQLPVDSSPPFDSSTLELPPFSPVPPKSPMLPSTRTPPPSSSNLIPSTSSSYCICLMPEFSGADTQCRSCGKLSHTFNALETPSPLSPSLPTSINLKRKADGKNSASKKTALSPSAELFSSAANFHEPAYSCSRCQKNIENCTCYFH